MVSMTKRWSAMMQVELIFHRRCHREKDARCLRWSQHMPKQSSLKATPLAARCADVQPSFKAPSTSSWSIMFKVPPVTWYLMLDIWYLTSDTR